MDKNVNTDLLEYSVKSRQKNLEKGLFDKISDKLNKMILEHNYKYDILDCGSGTGYYDNRLYEYLKKHNINPNISGFDISKNAVDFAKKHYPHINFFESDVNNINIGNNSKDIIFSILTPKNYQEYNRVLRDDGRLYIISYNKKEHFKEILKYVEIERKEKNLNNNLDNGGFKILSRENMEYKIELDNESLKDVIKTIPEYQTFDKKRVEELNKMQNFKITLSYIIIEAVKKDFFEKNLQQKCADRAGCIIISKENPRNIAITYDKMDKSLFFPKGHIDKNETAEQTALRETAEETGIKVKIVKPLKEFKHTSIYDKDDTHKISFFIADSLNDKINDELKIEKHIITLWINYKEILNLDLHENYKKFYLDNFKEIEEYIKWKLTHYQS